MKITIHQPEHFPYMGFFQKMQEADIFVVLDNVKFRKNYFQNRNRFLNKKGEEEWFGASVPKKSNSLDIKDVKVTETHSNKWKKKVISKLKHNFKIDFSSIYDCEYLIDINMKSIEWARQSLGIKNKIVYASDLSVTGQKTSLLLDICRKLEATKYISGPSGKDYLDIKLFENEGIGVDFFLPNVQNNYSCIYNITENKREK